MQFGARGRPRDFPNLYPIDEKDAALERTPRFLPFRPAVPVAAAGTATVDQVIAWQDFVWMGVGFTSQNVFVPPAATFWDITIEDVGASRTFQSQAFAITSLIGTNPGVSDSPAVDLYVPWVFLEKTTIRVQFTNNGGIANTPELLLIGYLTNWEREATAAIARQDLELKVLKAQAGDLPGGY